MSPQVTRSDFCRVLGWERRRSSDWRSARSPIEADRTEYLALYQHAPLLLCRGIPDNMHHSQGLAYRKPYLDDCRGVSMYTCIVACFYPLLSQRSHGGPVMLEFVTSDGPAINAVPHYWVLRSRHPLSSAFRLMAIGVYHRGLAPSRTDPSSPQ